MSSTNASLATKLRETVLEPIKRSLVGKDEIVEVLGVGLVSGENVFLLGPPGTGKSALIHSLASRLQGRVFDYLLTRFTEPSELFGPFDLRKLRDGDLVTNTEGMLPEADFVFLDELLNANSAILNSLLMALNERVFRRGRETSKLPMLIAVGASNRLPEDEALAALFDRFMLRVQCDNVPDTRLQEVLNSGWQLGFHASPHASMAIDEVRQLQSSLREIDLTPVMPAYMLAIRRLREIGMSISDRRAVRLQKTIAASAVLCGRSVALPSDLWVLKYVWDSPPQATVIASHLDAIVEEFKPTTDGSESERWTERHPMSESPSKTDPEALLRAMDALLEGEIRPTNLDSLTLLAARVEWIETEATRLQLRAKVDDVRQSIRAKLPPTV